MADRLWQVQRGKGYPGDAVQMGYEYPVEDAKISVAGRPGDHSNSDACKAPMTEDRVELTHESLAPETEWSPLTRESEKRD